MTTQHTSGEWTVHLPTGPGVTLEERLDFGIAANVNGENKIIAEVFGQVNHNNFAPAEANARLIAAAPDLLAACKNAVDNMRQQGIHICVEQMENAIAKAEGGAA